MAAEIRMPQFGVSMETGTIAQWCKAEGDPVKVGDVLASIETEKLTNDVISEVDGVLLKIVANLHPSAGHRAVLIGADGDELHVALHLASPDQVRHEYERPLQHAQKQRVLAMKLLIQLRAHFGDAGLQLLLCHQDLQDIPFHLAFHIKSLSFAASVI